MIEQLPLLLISLLYFGILLLVASLGDKRFYTAKLATSKHFQAAVYAFSLGIFLTTWTFYGSVGRAATSGWEFLGPYLGPIIFFIFCHRILRKIVLIAKRENTSTISDFISARYGKSRRLAVLVTLMATLGLLPYIALQIKAIDFSYSVTTSSQFNDIEHSTYSVLIIVLLIGLFSILFGTRRIDTAAHNPGMMLAIALESIVKVISFTAIGLFSVYFIFDGFEDIFTQVHASGHSGLTDFSPWQSSFLIEVLLGFFAVICLPRQFHVAVVENTNPAHLTTARWLFPAYILLFCLFMVPIAWAGHSAFNGQSAKADLYSILVPLAAGQNNLAILAYIGGVSAAISMAAISTVAISTMITNDIIMPFILHVKAVDVSQDKQLGQLLLNLRRVAIMVVLLLAYSYYLLIDQGTTLVSIGLSAFVAVAQFAPPMLIGLYWRRGHTRGATAGLVGGFLVWSYCTLLPNLTGLFAYSGNLISIGPFGIEWLRPTALFGLQMDPISHATVYSLSINILLYITVSLISKPRLIDRIQADSFVNIQANNISDAQHGDDVNNTVADVQKLLERFLGYRQTMRLINRFANRHPHQDLRANATITPELQHHTERTLAGIIGASSARIVVNSSLSGQSIKPRDVVSIVDDATKAVIFNRSLLQATIDNLSQGISVIDKDLNLEMWNRSYTEMFDFPSRMIAVGTPVRDIIRISIEKDEYGDIDPNLVVQQCTEMIQKGESHQSIRYRNNGIVIEVRGHAMPGGGYVNTYTDITEQYRTEKALRKREKQLQQANQTLEKRVAERTQTLQRVNQELTSAKAKAEESHLSKTRFLAAASHDLMQPLNAAKLFTTALSERQKSLLDDRHLNQLTGNLESSLDNAEQLISALIEISKLDAGSLTPRKQHFCVADLLKVLNQEFSALCNEKCEEKSTGKTSKKNLSFRSVPSQAILYTDPMMLRRILQNFLTNAMRYTNNGKMLLGCRRLPSVLEIQVWDTGLGIPEDRMQSIFEEFNRIEIGEHAQINGIGLGLAIAQRTANALGLKIRLVSQMHQGSMFAVQVPLGDVNKVTRMQPRAELLEQQDLLKTTVLVIDNDHTILKGMTALLEQWGCIVTTAAHAQDAINTLASSPKSPAPQVILADYHLDNKQLGTHAIEQVRKYLQQDIGAIIITADRTTAMKQEVRQAGYGLMHKPLRPAVLRKMITRYLSKF